MDQWEKMHRKQQELILKNEETEDQIRILQNLWEDVWFFNKNSQSYLEELTYEYSNSQSRDILEENYFFSQKHINLQGLNFEKNLSELRNEKEKLEERINQLAFQKRQISIKEGNDEY